MRTNNGSSGNTPLSWWQKTIVYEVYVNSFQDSNGDGYGDLNGICSRLDYLKELGVGAIWLTPFFSSPMRDNGYDVSDYYSINPRFGTMEDMDRLMEQARRRDIRIVIDLVYNHTSNQHPWFIESSKSRENEYSDWYIWHDPKPDGSEPNNWRAIFGGSAWAWCEARQQYYLHTFAVEQPDLNWENPKVRQALYDIANYWADKGAGGFRMDAIPYIKKPSDLSDGPADDCEGRTGIHAMTVNTHGILDFLHEFREKVVDGRDIFTVGEANGVPPSELKDWVGKNGVFSMLFEFSHENLDFYGAETWYDTVDWKLTDLKKALTASQQATAENGWYPIYFENHDKPRSIDHYFPGYTDPILAGRAIGTVLLTLRGTPFLYEGEELGYQNVHWDSVEAYDDLSTINEYYAALREGYTEAEALTALHRFSRDNARTPMQWTPGPGAGFTTGTPWLPIHDNYKTCNAETESTDPASVLSWYKELSAFRAATPALQDGNYREVLADSEQIYAYYRENNTDRLLVLVNFSGETADYTPEEADITDPAAAQILLSSYQNTGTAGPQIGTLRPYEAVIIRC